MAKPKKLAIIDGKRVLVSADYQSCTNSYNDYNQMRNCDNKEYMGFYKSAAWRHTRQQVLTRDDSTYVRCGLEGNIIDHIVPSYDDWNDRLNIDNLETLCQRCHNLKTRRDWLKRNKGSKRAMKIHIVIGYLASGKSIYFARYLTSHDLIYDYNSLASALDGSLLSDVSQSNTNSVHEHYIDVSDYVALIYEMILRKIKSEQTFNNVWSIMTKPDERLITLLSSYDVDWLMLDTTKDECINRLKQQYSISSWFNGNILDAYKHKTWVAYPDASNVGVFGNIVGWQYTWKWGAVDQDMSVDYVVFTNENPSLIPKKNVKTQAVKPKVENIIKLTESTSS